MSAERAARAARRWPRWRPRCARFHGSRSRCRRSFDSFRIVETYAETARERGGDVPDAYARGARARAADRGGARPAPSTSRCPATTICWPPTSSAASEQLWLVDWEYAGMGDRYFDLANFAVNNELGEAAEEALLARLLRRATPTPRAARRAAADAAHVGLPRGDVGRRAERSSPSSSSTSPPTPTSTSSACARPRPTRASRPGSRRPRGPRAELPDARALRDHRRRRRRRLDRLPPGEARLPRRRPARSRRAHLRARPSTPPGLVGQLRGSVSLTKMMMHSVERLPRARASESELDPGWVECGGIRLASSEERMEELRRQAGWAKTFGLPLELISADEAKEMFPLMSTEGVLGAAWLPTDGYIDPSQLTYALADVARREGDLQVFQNTRVTGIEVDDGRVRAVETEKGRIEAEVVVNAGGMFAAEIGRHGRGAGAGDPVRHQYLVTQPFREHAADAPAADPARSRPAGLLPRGRRRPGDGRLRARLPARLPARRPGRPRRDPARLQRPPARGRLGPLRRDHRELEDPGPGHGRGQDHQADQRPRGVHPRQRVLPRRVGGRAGSSSPRASAPMGSPAPAGSAR